jgi:ATP-dependent RNA helicase DDX51/DBP6
MFGVPRFTGIEQSKKPTNDNDSKSALNALLKRAEDRKEAQDGNRKRSISAEGGNAKDHSKHKKRKPIVSTGPQETTEERDSRKAASKVDKKIRKDLIRGDESTGKIEIKKASVTVDSVTGTIVHENKVGPLQTKKLKHSDISSLMNNKAISKTSANIEKSDEENKEEEKQEEEKIKNKIRPNLLLSKIFADDESKKVLNQKKADDDEDFNLNDDSEDHTTPFTEMTVTDSLDSWLLDKEVAKNLSEGGIESFFPVQQAVIPQLLRNNVRPCIQPRDMCVAAPTGSGKTIAYAIPIIQSLKGRSTIRLRALLVLPSRELATQVYGVFCRLSRSTNILTAVCTGQTSLEDEQKLIMGAHFNNGSKGSYGSIDSESLFSNRDIYYNAPGPLGISAVDILICTPGRLLDHIQNTAGFTLQHLRFLVLDEADRLLGNAYHSWVRTLVQSANSTESSSFEFIRSRQEQMSKKEVEDNHRDSGIDNTQSLITLSLPFLAIPQHPLQRLLFSATLADNPRKLAMLGINNPLVIRATSSNVTSNKNLDNLENEIEDQNPGEKRNKGDGGVIAAASSYMLPPTLEESVAVCETARRPSLLLSILLEAVGIPMQYIDIPSIQKVDGTGVTSNICSDKNSMCVIFSSSVDITHRLCRLLQSFNNLSDVDNDGSAEKYLFKGRVAEMSRLMRSDERETIMKDAANGDIKILVSSDHMARGIDLPNIKLVINYDPPSYAKMYVHRVGRTARANRIGHSITLLKAGIIMIIKKN